MQPLVPFAQLGDLELKREKIIKITNKVPSMIQKWGDTKSVRLAQYNKWIFSKKEPEYVLEKYPAFFKGYDLFYDNRMTRGFKYA
ncbi:hypothetical protein P3T76_001464 [Phytophthora citrophthora]|uniref:RxLR effector protein n=1 Tax=Phytophthora citrophthora TaxID=4793 RepID=A0AAD9LUQ4_9STRA|nr:hypothetical protein P3T76_001464 [Phytophthora citrophthora]